MDQGWCDGVFLFRINEGNSDGLTLSGRMVAMATDFPGPTMFDGNVTVRLYVDDGATPEQAQALEGIFSGSKGGPFERFDALVTNRLPAQRTSIQVQENGESITVKVGDFGQIKSQPMENEAGKPVMLENAVPLRIEKVQIAPSATQWSDPAMPRSFQTKSGGVGDFVWSGN